MRIALIGQQAFGKAVLEALLAAQRDELVGVFCALEREGLPPDPLRAVAEARGVPLFSFRRLRSPEALAQFRTLQPELAVMAYVTDIVPLEILNAPVHGTFQYHPSLLPAHRGPSSINWPIICGEKKTGLTIFWPDAGLDTGPILLQKEVAIEPDATVGSLYFEKLFPLGVEAVLEAIELVREGCAPRIPQDENRASYEGWCRAEHARIDWSRPVSEVYNLIRGCDPQPGAYTIFRGERCKLFNCVRGDTAAPGAEPGRVVVVDEIGFEVAAAGGTLRVHRVQLPDSKKISAAEFVTTCGLEPGEQLG